MEQFFYTYVIVSLARPDRYYIGFTENLEDSLNHHNAGVVPSTAPYRPWRYRVCMGFAERQRTVDFERYLKTHSGRAFLSKRL